MLARMKLVRIIPLAVLVIWSGGCSDDPTRPSNGDTGTVAEADSIASLWMQALADSLENLPGGEEPDYYRTIRYADVRDGMNDALAVNSASKVAHLGSAILDVLEINYSADLWNLVDSLRTYDEGSVLSPAFFPLDSGLYLRPGSPILRNQFALLATAPREYMRIASGGIPSNLTVAEFQRILDEVVIVALSSAIDHLAVADSDTGPVLYLHVEDETHEIDVGEVFFFHAALHAARAAFRMLTAYDLGLPGPDGTYGWIDDARAIHRCGNQRYFEPIGGGSPYRRMVDVSYGSSTGNPKSAAEDSVIVAIAVYNLESTTSGFLRRRTDGMAQAWDDLRAVRDNLEAAVASIRTETDPQENDIVKIADLVDLDDEIANGEGPDFAQNFTTIEDVLDWVESVMTGPYFLSETGSNGPINITVDLPAFFQGAPTDWRDLLPFHRFRPADQWQTDRIRYWYTYSLSIGAEYCGTGCDGVMHCYTDVAEYRYEDREVTVDPLEFLDPAGNPVDLEIVKVPFFPDYTFGGLFPGADRAKWLEIQANSGG